MPSETVQGQEQTISDIVRDYVNGIPIQSNGFQEQDEDYSELDLLADFDQMDKFEQQQYMSDLQNEIDTLRRRSSAAQQQEPASEAGGKPQQSDGNAPSGGTTPPETGLSEA